MVRPLTEEIFTETIMPIFRSEGGSFDIQRILTSRDSVPIDKYSIYGNLRETTRIHKYFRLAYKLGIRGMTTHMARFAAEFDKFRTRHNAHYYNISGRPFGSGLYHVQDPPRYAKVKIFLRRHLTREPTDKDVDLVVYTYFGSDAFSSQLSDLNNGVQDSYYNTRGRRSRDTTNRPPRRRQSRIRSYRNMYNNSTYRYHGIMGFRVSVNSNTNYSNNNNSIWASSNNGLGSNSNNNSPVSRPSAGQYVLNNRAVKRNSNKNKSNKRIQWQVNTVTNMPTDIISRENISNGEKVVKYSWKKDGQTHSRYLQPQSFRNYARMSMTDTFNKNASFSLFANPETRANVKRSNINFVILKKKVNKTKTNAATKIQKVVRGTQVRNKIRKNAQNALEKLSVVQKSVLRRKTEKQATAKKARAVRTEKLRVKRKR